MTAKEFLKAKKINDCDYMDSGMVEHIAKLLIEFGDIKYYAGVIDSMKKQQNDFKFKYI